MNDEQHLLASAYLDGALTDAERAQAEADPDVMAAVEQLRELRRALSVVDPPNPARRDAAINAALDAFDAERVPAAPPSVGSRGRRMNTWLIGAAAALVLVIAGGILATRGDDGGDDDSTAGGAAAATTEAGAQVLDEDAGRAAESTAGAERSPEARGPGTTGPGTLAAASATTNPTPNDVRLLPVLSSPEDLAEFAARAHDLSTADTTSTPRRCPQGRWRGTAIYVLDGVDTTVDVYLARRAGEVRAVDPSTCAVLVTTPAR